MLNQKFSSGTKKEKWELGEAEKESGRREKKSVEDRGGEGIGREERKGTEGPLSKRLYKWSDTFDHAIYRNHVREAREKKTRGRKMSRDWGNKKGKACKIPPAGRPAGNLCHPCAVGSGDLELDG